MRGLNAYNNNVSAKHTTTNFKEKKHNHHNNHHRHQQQQEQQLVILQSRSKKLEFVAHHIYKSLKSMTAMATNTSLSSSNVSYVKLEGEDEEEDVFLFTASSSPSCKDMSVCSEASDEFGSCVGFEEYDLPPEYFDLISSLSFCNNNKNETEPESPSKLLKQKPRTPPRRASVKSTAEKSTTTTATVATAATTAETVCSNSTSTRSRRGSSNGVCLPFEAERQAPAASTFTSAFAPATSTVDLSATAADHIQVAVRLRPLLKSEVLQVEQQHHNYYQQRKLKYPRSASLSTSASTAASSTSSPVCCWKVLPEEKQQNQNGNGSGTTLVEQSSSASSSSTASFTLDRVFDEFASTRQVHAQVTRPLVQAVLGGRHATILAYGQTGSGKTHTMQGNNNYNERQQQQEDAEDFSEDTSAADTDGIIQLVATDLFEHIDAHPEREYTVKAQYFEIYNEQIRDLLLETTANNNNSFIHRDSDNLSYSTTGNIINDRDNTDHNGSSSSLMGDFYLKNGPPQEVATTSTSSSSLSSSCQDYFVEATTTSLSKIASSRRKSLSSISTSGKGLSQRFLGRTRSSVGGGGGGVIKALTKTSRNKLNHHRASSSALPSPTSSSSAAMLQIREVDGVPVVNAVEEEVCCVEDVRQLLKEGSLHRAVASTGQNRKSSRSHAIFRITIESLKADASEATKWVSVLNLVDLAGSESTHQSATTGLRRREGGKINQSLLSLSRVIYSLSMPEKKRPKHINYRDSKLTRILQPHLSGNACMAVLCCISPSLEHLEESRSTLKFASSAKQVQTKPRVNQVLDTESLLKKLQHELSETKQALKNLQCYVSTTSSTSLPTTTTNTANQHTHTTSVNTTPSSSPRKARRNSTSQISSPPRRLNLHHQQQAEPKPQLFSSCSVASSVGFDEWMSATASTVASTEQYDHHPKVHKQPSSASSRATEFFDFFASSTTPKTKTAFDWNACTIDNMNTINATSNDNTDLDPFKPKSSFLSHLPMQEVLVMASLESLVAEDTTKSHDRCSRGTGDEERKDNLDDDDNNTVDYDDDGFNTAATTASTSTQNKLLREAEMRAKLLEEKLTATDQLVETLFRDLEAARRTSQELQADVDFWRSQASQLMANGTTTLSCDDSPNSKTTTGSNKRKSEHGWLQLTPSTSPTTTAVPMMRTAFYSAMFFYATGQRELFLSTVMFMWMSLESASFSSASATKSSTLS